MVVGLVCLGNLIFFSRISYTIHGSAGLLASGADAGPSQFINSITGNEVPGFGDQELIYGYSLIEGGTNGNQEIHTASFMKLYQSLWIYLRITINSVLFQC